MDRNSAFFGGVLDAATSAADQIDSPWTVREMAEWHQQRERECRQQAAIAADRPSANLHRTLAGLHARAAAELATQIPFEQVHLSMA